MQTLGMYYLLGLAWDGILQVITFYTSLLRRNYPSHPYSAPVDLN